MEKIELLMETYPDDLNRVVNELYMEKFPKKKKDKTIYNFKVMGKEYVDNVFTKNYINFLKDISLIHGYNFFAMVIPPYFLSKDGEGLKQVHKINEGIYVSTYSSTEKKIGHIKEVCELMGLNIVEI